ncbi:MAG: alcohol dehydrogenase catalytic domain-containing protein [bacterium]|nr:alcohol dehydrogenase catalytic domain-containing protein [bacterium]
MAAWFFDGEAVGRVKGLYYDGALSFRADLPVPGRRPGESLVAVTLAGICATDIEIARGYMVFRGVPGHEFVGRVAESDRAETVGRRVVGEINCPCGDCDLCRGGRGNHCPTRTILGIAGRDGAFAEYLVLPDENLRRVPDGMGDREAVFTEPLAAACRAVEHAAARPGERVAVLGDGRLGLLAAMAFAASGVPATVIGRSVRKLALARERGIRAMTLEEAGKGFGADVVVEATGCRDGLAHALSLTRPQGRIVMKTTIAGRHEVNLAPLVVDEIALIGSRCGPFDRALALLASGAVDLRGLVSGEFPIERGLEAMEEARAPGALKVLLACGR